MEQQLLAILDSEENKKYYRYLLLDALTTVSEMDFISLNNIHDLLGDEAITTVERTDLAYDLSSCPKLITIGKPNEQLAKRLLHFSVVEAQSEILQTKRYVCAWMVSEHPPEMIAQQMVSIGLFLTKYYGAGFVPFYEPFRMQLLQQSNLICPEFLADMLSCFKHYSYPTITQTLNTINQLDYKPDSINCFLSQDAKFYQQQLKIIFELYHSQARIYSETGKDVNSINLIEIARAYQQAYLCGLTQKNDQFIFALMTLRYGQLLANSQLKQAVDEAKIDEGSLSVRFQAIDRAQFLSINEQYLG
ncbi:hypothetical protein DES39_1526 [Orbus hercynius]|uniref:DUF4123 domain-containing protein n=1 Tax=Orbus hercynius TaxID=593135 RepID=A0A495RFQ2_9GAMM|nr:hypothetical protein [Orbus hercynius]RKS86100.1 hypothetical protein DES39_1526 [Orbus hercynius]